ncbi:hypothetical protein PENSPDRAFT_649299 [Peniophora sp. CONT]|nr:hypothetical protein PENSPDRAFT_649299 [Peniophora sp. CONT]
MLSSSSQHSMRESGLLCDAEIQVCSISLQEAQELVERGKPLISGSFCSDVLDLGGDRLLKYGNSVCRSEAVAMQYVRERTTIPVPRVFAYTHDPERYNVDREGYFVMEKLPGVALLEKLKDLSARDTTFIATQLKDIVSQLRTLDDTSRWGMIGKNGVFSRRLLLIRSLARHLSATSASRDCRHLRLLSGVVGTRETRDVSSRWQISQQDLSRPCRARFRILACRLTTREHPCGSEYAPYYRRHRLGMGGVVSALLGPSRGVPCALNVRHGAEDGNQLEKYF